MGIRENVCDRCILERTIIKKETPYGEVRIKRSEGYGVTKEKYEYEDLAKIASENNLSIDDVLNKLKEES